MMVGLSIKAFSFSVRASFLLGIFFCLSCAEAERKSQTLFTSLKPDDTGITFVNTLTYSEEFNPYTFRNFFNGGGVAVGDINGDNLPDLFFCFNQQSNRLFLNKGNFEFEDI